MAQYYCRTTAKGEKTWTARIRKQGHSEISKTFKLKAQAERWAREVEIKIDGGDYIDRRAANKITIDELLQQYRLKYIDTDNEANRKKGRSYLSSIRRISEAFGYMVLSAVTEEKINQYRDKRLGQVGASSVRHELNLLSSLVRLAKENGIKLPVNPVREVRLPKEPKGRERRLEGDELDRLLTACSYSEMRALIVVAVETAARLGELLSLRWEDVDFDKQTAYIEMTKNGESRTLPLSFAAIAALQELEPHPFKARIFWRWEHSDSFTGIWARTCARAGVKKLRFHDLRHEAISRLAESGKFNLLEIAAISGHKILAMLKRYSHVRPETLAAKLNA